MALNKRGMNCFRRIFENFEGLMNLNEELQRKEPRKPRTKIVLKQNTEKQPVVSSIQSVVYTSSI